MIPKKNEKGGCPGTFFYNNILLFWRELYTIFYISLTFYYE